jgi:23S rRNA pseudouridine1911/1915/1917 synthase
MADSPPAAGRHTVTVSDGVGDRLDVLVARALDVSRTQAATLIATGRVTVAGRAERASHRPDSGDVIEVDVPPARGRDVTPEPIPLAVVFEDEHLLVIDKPPGMVVHPAPGHWSGTLVNALLGRGGTLAPGAAPDRAGLVHRLDKDTSGLLIVAKSDRVHRRLSAALADRRIVRRYAVLSWGHLRSDRQTVDAPIARDPRERRRMAVVASGRRAVTEFVRIARYAAVDLLRAHLQTGRTHQIRVHLAHLGHPVVGDATYGGGRRSLPGLPPRRHFLHAAWLVFRHPITDERCDFRSELPVDLRAALAHAAGDETLIVRPHPLEYLGFYDIDG